MKYLWLRKYIVDWLPFSSNGALDMKWKLINGVSLLLAFCYGLQKGIGQSG